MMITAIIFTLSILLVIGYSIGMRRVFQNRLASNDINQPLDEELIMDMAEYKMNVKKLAAMSVAIGACFALTFFIR